MPLRTLRPASVNDTIYKPVETSDPHVKALAEKIRAQGLLEPIVITTDGVILSGHRRRAACLLAGLEEVPVRRHPVRSTDPEFLNLLVSFNAQRVKSVDEVIREAVVTTDPRSAYAALLAHREEESLRARDQAEDAGLCLLSPDAAKKRSAISRAKSPMLEAVRQVLSANRSFWPLTLRQIHYRLLNDPPLRNAKDAGSRYANNRRCYSDLSDLLTRARLAGLVSWSAVHDPTRPASRNYCDKNLRDFIDEQLDSFMWNYHRDLLQSQSSYFEIVGEKQTVETIIERAAEPYTMRHMIGRGYSSIDARYQLAVRFHRSHKARLTLLFLGDHDPEGENIPNTFAASMRDEFGIYGITAVKVALTREQVERLDLPPVMTAKETSSRTAGFVAEHGEAVYELEAVEPEDLTEIIQSAIEGVLDMKAFERERAAEESDALELDQARQRALIALGNFRTSPDGGGK